MIEKNKFNIRAYAKINLGLQVLRHRDDGYHDINTIFYKIQLFDELEFEFSDDLKLEIFTEQDLNIKELNSSDNLIIKAAEILKKKFPEKSNLGASIKLNKSIPIGGGLGGGSSDAAATLIGLNNLWNLNLSQKELSELSLELGSDVPFFINQEFDSAVGLGRGEILDYFNSNLEGAILLINPNIHISTRWAYESLNINNRIFEPVDFKNSILNFDIDENILKARLFNDFEPVVFAEYLEISDIKELLYKKGAIYAQMSGSGSTVFGIFRDLESAEKASKNFNKNYFVFSSLIKYLPV